MWQVSKTIFRVWQVSKTIFRVWQVSKNHFPYGKPLKTFSVWQAPKKYFQRLENLQKPFSGKQISTVIPHPKISRYFLILKKATRDLNPRALAFFVQMVQMHTN